MPILDDIQGTKVKFRHGSKELEFDIMDVFDIDNDDLSKEFSKQPALFAYFSALQADAERLTALAEFDRDAEYAAADEAYRHALDLQDKKYTEAVIRSNVLQDEDYDAANRKFLEFQYFSNLLKLIVRALSQRSEMLISLGAQIRQEISMTGMNVREKSYKDAVVDVKERIDEIRKKQV